MHSPLDKHIVFTFQSHPTKDLTWRWCVRLEFPPGSTAETVLPITAEDGNGDPVVDAVFEFAGQKLKITDGRGSITYADFIRGKSEVPLWMYRKGMPPVPGGLTFA